MLAEILAEIDAESLIPDTATPLGEIDDEIDGEPNSSQIGSESSSNICALFSSNTPGGGMEALGLADTEALGLWLAEILADVLAEILAEVLAEIELEVLAEIELEILAEIDADILADIDAESLIPETTAANVVMVV